MQRLDDDWATAKISAQYGIHLRSEARKNNELLPDPRYTYLAANSAKRRKNAQRGLRPGFARDRDSTNTHNDDHQDSGPSEAGPSSLPNINTAADEDMMDVPGLFGFTQPSDDEEESGVDDGEDVEE